MTLDERTTPMAIDGVYIDDPSEAVTFLRDHVLGKKLIREGMEVRPWAVSDSRYLGMARTQASVRMDLPRIPRVAISNPKGKAIPVWVIPQQGVDPSQVEAKVRAGLLDLPDAQISGTNFKLNFPKDTSPEKLVAFAQAALLAVGVQPGQGWQWTKRGGDQLPK
jgi:hypothetical protein